MNDLRTLEPVRCSRPSFLGLSVVSRSELDIVLVHFLIDESIALVQKELLTALQIRASSEMLVF
jgi:hypothetical protein